MFSAIRPPRSERCCDRQLTGQGDVVTLKVDGGVSTFAYVIKHLLDDVYPYAGEVSATISVATGEAGCRNVPSNTSRAWTRCLNDMPVACVVDNCQGLYPRPDL